MLYEEYLGIVLATAKEENVWMIKDGAILINVIYWTMIEADGEDSVQRGALEGV